MDVAGPFASSPVELKARLALEREGQPFLVFRDASDSNSQRLIRLLDAPTRLTVGRSETCDIALPWDEQVSRLHAQLERIGTHWTIGDGGLSRNGSFVNGERVVERRRLFDADVLRFGLTAVLFRQPGAERPIATAPAHAFPGPLDLSPAQRAVLRALCRPFAESASWARPATNPEICEELVLSVDAVKGHLRVLFAKFGLENLPQNEKRLRLAERALTSGAVTVLELREEHKAE